MPDAQGRLSPAEIEFVTGWITRQAGGAPPNCPVCRSQSWAVLGQVTQGVVYPYPVSGQHPVLYDIAYPHVGVLCTTCGYTMFFNAGLMGLYPRPAAGSSNVLR